MKKQPPLPEKCQLPQGFEFPLHIGLFCAIFELYGNYFYKTKKRIIKK